MHQFTVCKNYLLSKYFTLQSLQVYFSLILFTWVVKSLLTIHLKSSGNVHTLNPLLKNVATYNSKIFIMQMELYFAQH